MSFKLIFKFGSWMRQLIFLLFVLPLLGFASDIFDKAADLYINGKLNESKHLIETALQANPADEKLQQLLAKIEEEQQQEQQQQQQDQQQESEEQNEEEQQEQQQNQQQQEEQQQAEEQQAQQQQAEQSEDEINKEEAERILNALKEDEQDAQKKKAPVKAQGRRAEKDW